MRRFDMRLPALVRLSGSAPASKDLQDAAYRRAVEDHAVQDHSPDSHPFLNHPGHNYSTQAASATREISGDNPETHEFWTETQNVSARGIFFYADRALAEGSQLEITMTFPPHITMGGSVRVKFAARVLRVETPLAVSRTGIAAVIEDYEFLKAIAPGQIDFQKN